MNRRVSRLDRRAGAGETKLNAQIDLQGQENSMRMRVEASIQLDFLLLFYHEKSKNN